MIVDELVAILGYDVRGEGELRKFNAGLENAQRKASAFAAALVRIGAIAATAAAAGMAALGKSVISTSAQFEGYAATLETIEGSQEKAQAALDWISDFARKTPYEVSELTEAFVRLRAYGMDPTTGLMESLGDASSAMGKSLMQAVEMVADASTGEFERLKEFGMRASVAGDQVTVSWTENGKAMSKTVKKTGDEITKFIQERFSERFSGAMIRQSKTWNGMMSNLGDAWVDFQRRIGEGGFFDAVKAQLGGLLDYINRLDADGTLDRWSKNLGNAFTWTADTIGSFATRMARHVETISGLITDYGEAWKVVQAVLLGLAIGLFPVTAAFFGVGLAIDDFLTYLRGGESVIGDFINWLGQMRNALVQWLAELPGKITAGIRNAFQAAFDAARGIVNDFVAWATAKLAALNPLNWMGSGETGSFDSSRFGGGPTPGTTSGAMENWFEHQRRMSASGAVAAAVNDNSQDHRDMSNHVTINQTVTQATDAPRAAANATASAVSGAAGAARVSRYEQDGAF